MEASKKFSDGSLDFVYIDARHEYDSVKEDIVSWLPKIKKGSFIGGHDYKRKRHDEVIKAINEILGEPEKVFCDSSWVFKVV